MDATPEELDLIESLQHAEAMWRSIAAGIVEDVRTSRSMCGAQADLLRRAATEVVRLTAERDSVVGSYYACRHVLQVAGIPCQFGKDGQPTTDTGTGRDLADCVRSLVGRLQLMDDRTIELPVDILAVAQAIGETDPRRSEELRAIAEAVSRLKAEVVRLSAEVATLRAENARLLSEALAREERRGRVEAERDRYRAALVLIRDDEQSVCEAWHEFIVRLRGIAANALAVRAAARLDQGGGK